MTTPWIVALLSLWAIVLLIGLVLVGLMRRTSGVLDEAESRLREVHHERLPGGLAPGTSVPPIELKNASGSSFSLAWLHGRPSIILFMATDCPPCESLLAELSRSDFDSVGVGLFVIVEDSPEGRSLRLSDKATCLYQSDHEAFRAFRTSVTPHAFAIDAAGRITETMVPNSLNDLQRLASELRRGGEANRSPSRVALPTSIAKGRSSDGGD
jgi:thiol-disulfide isomerase/thioredoxin